MIITQYWPDPLLQGDAGHISNGGSDHQIWSSPFPMLFADNSKNSGGGDVTYTITNLPAGADLTFSCRFASVVGDTNVYVLRSDWNWIAKSNTFSGDGGIVTVKFTVPSDGIARIRFQLAARGKGTFSSFVVCDSDKIEKLRELVGDAQPANDKHAVWGGLMPLA